MKMILKKSLSPIKSKVSHITKKPSHPAKFFWKHKFFEPVQGLNLSVTVVSVSCGLGRSNSRAQTWAFFPEHCASRGRSVYQVLEVIPILLLYFVLPCLTGQKFCILMNSSTWSRCLILRNLVQFQNIYLIVSVLWRSSSYYFSIIFSLLKLIVDILSLYLKSVYNNILSSMGLLSF